MKRLLTVLVFFAGCSLATETPEAPPRPADAVDVTMQFCEGQLHWFAYKNPGFDWVRYSVPFGQREFRFPASPTVTVVTGFGFSGSNPFSSATVLNLTAAEADAYRCRLTPFGAASMTGLVTTESAEDATVIQLGDAVDFTLGNQAFEMTELGSGTLDLVAINRIFSMDDNAPARVIVRNGLTVADNAGIPKLDFASAEAKPFGSVTVQHDDMAAVGFVLFETSRKTRASLVTTLAFGDNGSVTLPVMPAEFIKAGDLHRFDIQGLGRGITYWQAVPADTTVTFGPAMSALTVDTITSTPILRTRMRFASQSAYPAVAEAVFLQLTSTTTRLLEVITTAAFLGGTPAQWEISIPDLRGVIPDTWILRSGTATSHAVTVRDARPSLYNGVELPQPGETMRWATKSAQ